MWYFAYRLLGALDGLHAHGMMHRDVKPRNVLVCRGCGGRRRSLMLLDLGLADFYRLAAAYNELLCGMRATIIRAISGR